MDLKANLKAEAIALGFADCRIAAAEPAPHYPHYLGWLEAGRHAGMDYLASPRAIMGRQSPQELLPGCRSVICLAWAFAPNPATPREAERPVGRIAAYATYPDYHDVLGEKLGQLADWLQEAAPGTVSKTCVDTSAILEKDYAQAAGLGWIGRNSLLAHPVYGSWILLGELLTDLPLEPDGPVEENHCAACLRCHMACPTKAILSERSIDANRCLSYLSIEHRGPIPAEFRALMGNRLFGCDTCQAICPDTPKTLPGADQFKPVLNPDQDLLEILAMDELAFKNRFGRTPVARAKLKGLRRNAAICLGNSRQTWLLPVLQEQLVEEMDSVVAEALTWAIQTLQESPKAA